MEFENFYDVLIPGIKQIKLKDLNKAGDFDLKAVVEFKPKYLAGWPAITYSIPLAKAALQSRERVIRRVCRKLPGKVSPYQPKRDLRTGSVQWLKMTFKYVLLPLWSGSYMYKGENYRVFINGQTGTVDGEKPRDSINSIAFIFKRFLRVIVILALLMLFLKERGWLTF